MDFIAKCLHYHRRDLQEQDNEINNVIQDQQQQELAMIETITTTSKRANSKSHSPVILSPRASFASSTSTTTTTTCEICIEPLALENIFNYNNNNQCNHSFCTDCISKYIRIQIEANILKIRCPAWKCKQMLDPMLCSTIISKQRFDRWCDALCLSSLSRIEHRCYCPYMDCKELIINECGGSLYDERKVKCPMCKKYLCFECKVPWHENKGCKFGEGHMHDLFVQLARRRGWRKCPSCRHWIERTPGCKIIHCRCGSLFCYKCGEQHDYRPCRLDSRKQRYIGICICTCCIVLLTILALILSFLIRNKLRHRH